MSVRIQELVDQKWRIVNIVKVIVRRAPVMILVGMLVILTLSVVEGQPVIDTHAHDVYSVGNEMIMHTGPVLFQNMAHIYFDLIAAVILLFMAWIIKIGTMRLVFVILGLSSLLSFASVFSMRELMWAAPLVHSVGALGAGLVLFILVTSPQNRALFRALRIRKRSSKSKKQKKKSLK